MWQAQRLASEASQRLHAVALNQFWKANSWVQTGFMFRCFSKRLTLLVCTSKGHLYTAPSPMRVPACFRPKAHPRDHGLLRVLGHQRRGQGPGYRHRHEHPQLSLGNGSTECWEGANPGKQIDFHLLKPETKVSSLEEGVRIFGRWSWVRLNLRLVSRHGIEFLADACTNLASSVQLPQSRPFSPLVLSLPCFVPSPKAPMASGFHVIVIKVTGGGMGWHVEARHFNGH